MQQCIIGWDIGGAHIKAAKLELNDVISDVYQQACPLWKGLDYLNNAVKQILDDIADNRCIHVITMTGELVDLFDSRDQGVNQIIQAMQCCLNSRDFFVYAGTEGFLRPEEVKNRHCSLIASANWLASVSLVANKLNQGLFIDIGSTTTDILVYADHQVQALGYTDFDRLVSDELVYTGVVRTAVMAVAQKACFRGNEMGLMAEYFSTMADVYRLTGELNDIHDQADTADGAEKTVLASAKRLSRMTGFEFKESDLPLWSQFAQTIKSQQKSRIKQACERQLSRNMMNEDDPIVGAGVGRFLVKQIADELGYAYIDFTGLFDHNKAELSFNIADCAPAVSVALLLTTI